MCWWWYPPKAALAVPIDNPAGQIGPHQNYIYWGSGGVALGESTGGNNPGWRSGAAENGGVNLVVAHSSVAAEANNLWDEYNSAFAGLHIFSFMMPQWYADAIDSPYFGSELAYQWQNNSTSSVAIAWSNGVEQNDPVADGQACGLAGFSQGGGHGFSGCGCYVSMSVDASATLVEWHATSEDWDDLQVNGYDGIGTGYYWWVSTCNYDVQTWPLSL